MTDKSSFTIDGVSKKRENQKILFQRNVNTSYAMGGKDKEGSGRCK